MAELSTITINGKEYDIKDAEARRLIEESSKSQIAIDATLKVSGKAADAKVVGDTIDTINRYANGHYGSKQNPHNVTATQLGLGNVDNTSDLNKPVSTAQASAIAEAKKAGDDAQATANSALTTANNAQTAAGNAMTKAEEKLPKSGGTMTGSIAMGNNKISGLGSPTNSTDAVNKSYVDEKRKNFTATISSTWTGSGPYTQSITVNGILATDTPHIMPNYDSNNTTAIAQKEAWGMVSKAITSSNAITFTCFEEKPTTSIPIIIEVIR